MKNRPTMKVFISHSNAKEKLDNEATHPSHAVARALHEWLPLTIQAVQPFLAEYDITPGTDWLAAIMKRLHRSKIGIICLTPDNIGKPWINFESGAIARQLRGQKRLVIPYMFGFPEAKRSSPDTSNNLQNPQKVLSGTPLGNFQGLLANREGTLKLVQTLNDSLPNRLDDTRLNKAFDAWWPWLDEKFTKIIQPTHPEIEVRTESIEEMRENLKFCYYGSGKETRRGYDDFQDFGKLTKRVGSPVQYLWADAEGPNTIQARIPKARASLIVAFDNEKGRWPGNVAIRGSEDRPYLNKESRRYLVFRVRSLNREEDAPDVAVAVRIVNGYAQHWMYARSPTQYICTRIVGTEWINVVIDLANKDEWHRFDSDGNPGGPSSIDLGCICSVVLEFGRPPDNAQSTGSENEVRPLAGSKGMVQIGPLCLFNDPKVYDDKYPRPDPTTEATPD